MRRLCVTLCAFFVVGASTTYAQDHWFARWNRQVHVVKDRNKFWPQPFVEADRDSVEDPFRVMVDNGYKLQHLMSAHHFDGVELNEAGRIKAQWLVMQAPAHRRSIYVQRSLNPQETAGRIRSVEAWTSKVLRGGHVTVLASNHAPLSTSGERLDQIYRKAADTIPDPRIPPSSGAGFSE
jgi:hypothetical protein